MSGPRTQEGTVCGPCCRHDLQPGPPDSSPSSAGTHSLTHAPSPWARQAGLPQNRRSLGGGHKAAILRLTRDLASDGGCGRGGSRTFYLRTPPTSFVFSCGFRE